ncbi:MAG: hypothetical protein V1890_07500 [Candidatus Zixiibacteriota bacterium]
MNHIKTFIYLLLLVFIISSLSCFSSLQTAKTTDGIGLATGLYRYEVLRHWNNQWENHYFLILAPSIGRSAKENKVGLEGRLKFLTDIVDKDREPLWFLSEELKIQAHKNKYIDFALTAEFWFYYPGSISVLVSKDINRFFTLYGQYKLLAGPYILSDRDYKQHLMSTLNFGTEINLTKNISALFEIERWLTREWLNEREKTRYAVGVNFHFPLSRK